MIAWFARNHVTANLLMLAIVFIGALALKNKIPLEVFPTFESDQISISTRLRGGSPSDIEKGITIPIEETLQNINGIKDISSRSSEGGSSINITVDTNYDPDQVFLDVKNKVDSVNNLPNDVDRPITTLQEQEREVITMALYGNYSESALRDIAEIIKEELISSKNISRVTLDGVRDYEISIEISQQKLTQYHLSLSQIAQKLNQASIDLSAGFLRTAGGDVAIRTRNQAYTGNDFGKIPITTSSDGAVILLKDVAKITDAFGENETYTRFNNETAVMLEIYRTGKESALSVADAVKAYAEKKSAQLPTGMKISLWNDRSITLKARLDSMLSNALQGAILVLIVLGLFLRPAIAFWVFMGIPVSFIGSFAVLGYFDISLNSMSLFGYILALGIVVDDAIVTGENVYTHLRRGSTGLEAAIVGTQEVAMPILFGVLVTITAFIPLLFIEGARSKLFSQIPAVIIPVLLLSLIESKFILPAHLKHLHYNQSEQKNAILRFQAKIADSLEYFVEKYYTPLLEKTLDFRYFVLLIFISLFLITMAFVVGGQLRFSFFPKIPSERVSLDLVMPSGTPFDITDKNIMHIAQAAYQLQKEYREETDLDIIRNILSISGRGGNSHQGVVRFEVMEAENRSADFNVEKITARWRKKIGEIPGAESFTINAQIGRSGKPIDIELRSSDIQKLAKVRDQVRQRLETYSGVFDINDSLANTTKEFTLELLPRATALGLNQVDIAQQVRYAFYGFEVQRFQRGRNEISVFLRTPKTQRYSFSQLQQLPITLPNGSTAPLQQLANLQATESPEVIYRINRQRTLSIRADADTESVDMRAIYSDMQHHLEQVLTQYPGVSYEFKGEAEEQRESFNSLAIGVLAVLFVIYTLLAIPFKSYLQPLIVMSVIPFGLVGAIWGHMIMNINLAIMSIMGMMALIGILVNDSLVLVDYINKRREQTGNTRQAIIEAGPARFRPIMLTSVTTFVGLVPLLLEKSTQAQILIPMAISLGFGIIFATVIALLLIPMNYLFMEDIAHAWQKWRNKKMRLIEE